MSNSNSLLEEIKSDLYDLDEPPHSFNSSTQVVVSYGGLILKKQVAAYICLLFRLNVGGIKPDMRYFVSKYGRLTITKTVSKRRLNYEDYFLDIED